MVAVAYPTASYPDDPLEIPVDPMTSIEMEVYTPNLVHHQSVSGAQFFLKQAEPRWRGTVTWAACYTNSERAGAIEGYLMGLNEGIYTSTLKHGREILNAPTIDKRGDGIGRGTVAVVDPTPQGPGIQYMTGFRSGPRNRWAVRCFVGNSRWYRRGIVAEAWSGDANANQLGMKIDDLSGTVQRLDEGAHIGARTLGYYFSVDTVASAVWIRWGLLPANNQPRQTIFGRFYKLTTTQSGTNEADTYNRYKRVPEALPLSTDTTGGGHKPGQVFKLSTGDYRNRIFMVTSIASNGSDLTFTPEIDIFGSATQVALDATDANKFLTVRATPGQTIQLPRSKPLSGPWTMPWIEGV